MPSPLITLLTDFGGAEAFVGIMKGVILGINPDARLVDLSHAVPPQHLKAGALLLRSAVPFFPPGTVHLVVVDPGVGSSRRPLLVETDTGFLVGPDNGVLCPAAALMGRRVIRLIANETFFGTRSRGRFTDETCLRPWRRTCRAVWHRKHSAR